MPTGPGGTPLAVTTGARNAQLRLQVQLTNNSAVADDITLTGPAGSTGTSDRGTWNVRYAVAGNDDTADVVGAGLTIHLEPFASAYVLTTVFGPSGFEGTPTFPIQLRAVSGNAGSVSTQQAVLATDGSSTPTLGATQADGSGSTAWPDELFVSPYLYLGGAAGSARLVPSIAGTGHNRYTLRGELQSNSTGDTGLKITRGTTDVTAAVLAGTFTFDCYSDIGCLPLTVRFTPGHVAGSTDVRFTMTSTIDGRINYAEVAAYVAANVGPDLYTTPPRTGYGLIESTPNVQVISTPVLVGHTAAQRVILRSVGTLTDTFAVRAAVTGPGTVTYTATAADLGRQRHPG